VVRTHGQVGVLSWVLVQRGRYAATAPWGASLEIERRRAEGGEPAGWYLYGELATGGCLEGRWLADHRDDAMASAEAWVAAVADGA
jgi:hypothetical protein